MCTTSWTPGEPPADGRSCTNRHLRKPAQEMPAAIFSGCGSAGRMRRAREPLTRPDLREDLRAMTRPSHRAVALAGATVLLGGLSLVGVVAPAQASEPVSSRAAGCFDPHDVGAGTGGAAAARGGRSGTDHRDLPASERAAVEKRSEEHTSELQSHVNPECRLLLEKKKHAPGPAQLRR